MKDEKITIELTPQVPTETRNIPWYPPGRQIALEAKDGQWRGAFQIGDFSAIHVWFQKNEDTYEAVLELDMAGCSTVLKAAAEGTDEKRYYSFYHCLTLTQDDGRTRPYPISLWYVENSEEPEAPQLLRWTRKGWHQGEFTHCDDLTCEKAYVLITDDDGDGIFEKERDAWKLDKTEQALHSSPRGVRLLKDFIWFNHQAYRVLDLDRDGHFVTIERFDPGITEEEDYPRRDVLREDREAPRAPQSITFQTDLKQALSTARAEGLRVLVDFTATWCGPCQTMEKLVFPSQALADAGQDVIFVKIYEHEDKESVKAYEVTGYPTLILMEPDGQVIRRVSGYQSIKAMVEFLR